MPRTCWENNAPGQRDANWTGLQQQDVMGDARRSGVQRIGKSSRSQERTTGLQVLAAKTRTSRSSAFCCGRAVTSSSTACRNRSMANPRRSSVTFDSGFRSGLAYFSDCFTFRHHGGNHRRAKPHCGDREASPPHISLAVASASVQSTPKLRKDRGLFTLPIDGSGKWTYRRAEVRCSESSPFAPGLRCSAVRKMQQYRAGMPVPRSIRP